MINRHSLINGDIESTIDGEYVKYAEHSAVVDALRAELARVREALQEIAKGEGAMRHG